MTDGSCPATNQRSRKDRSGAGAGSISSQESPRQGNRRCSTSTRLQRGEDYQHPYEILGYVPGTTANYYLAIEKKNCADEPDWMQLRLTATTTLERHSGDHDVGVPAESNNAGMLAVGAARHDNTNDVRDSSNRGPTVLPHLGGHTKPDIVGATCVATKTDPPEFCGTSGAAPHVAGLVVQHL